MIKRMWQWLRVNVLNKNMLFWFIIAELIFWSPCIITGILALFNPYLWTITLAVILFWAGPFTPAIPLQLGLAFLLKKICTDQNKVKSKYKEEQNNDV